MRRILVVGALVAGLGLVPVTSQAQPTDPASSPVLVREFFGDVAGFDAASSGAPVRVGFDHVRSGTDVSGRRLRGARFSAGAGEAAAPIVVSAADTFTPPGFESPVPFDPADNTLPATSGRRVLSPGGARLGPGPDPAVEDDDLVVSFDRPVTAVGFDVLFQSLDCCSFVSVTLTDPSGAVIAEYDPIPTGQPEGAVASPGGAVFVGFTASAPRIATLVVDEYDANAVFPDANIGYDTFRYTTRSAAT
jgi:hypothetical protein